MARSFIILHGWRNYRPPRHWQYELAHELNALGEDVHYPALPNADAPVKNEWLAVLAKLWDSIPAGNERVIIAHSLGTSLWFHAAAELGFRSDRVLLVAPVGPSALVNEPFLQNFAPLPESLDGSKWRIVGSDADPYCVEGAADYFGTKYGCDADLIPGAVHFSLNDGYGHWPSALAWSLDPKVRLSSRWI